MTRPFRTEEDERRYFALRSEFFVQLAKSGLPAQMIHDIMRNFGKLEDMMFFEGVRQGMAAALLYQQGDYYDDGAVQVHASVYGPASATPLTRVERSLVMATGLESRLDHPWLDASPMEFGPLTLTEAVEKYGPDLRVDAPVQGHAAPVSAGEEAVTPTESGLPEDLGGDEVPDFKELEELPIEDAPPIEQPALLDRFRDILLKASPPQTWHELVLLLHRETLVDAGHVDQVMSTPMGMTVISQAKLFHLHPGSAPQVKFVPRP